MGLGLKIDRLNHQLVKDLQIGVKRLRLQKCAGFTLEDTLECAAFST